MSLHPMGLIDATGVMLLLEISELEFEWAQDTLRLPAPLAQHEGKNFWTAKQFHTAIGGAHERDD